MTDQVAHRLAAIFAADVAGYSRLMENGEEWTLRQLTACRQIMDSKVVAHGGRIVNSVGDSVLAEFASTIDALDSAIAIQTQIAETAFEIPPKDRLLFRIGLHLGEVMVQGNDIYGNGVNVAARLQALADAGGIVVSGAVFDACKRLPYQFIPLGVKPMKNIEEPVSAYRVSLLDESASLYGEPAWRRGLIRAGIKLGIPRSWWYRRHLRKLRNPVTVRAFAILFATAVGFGGLIYYWETTEATRREAVRIEEQRVREVARDRQLYEMRSLVEKLVNSASPSMNPSGAAQEGVLRLVSHAEGAEFAVSEAIADATKGAARGDPRLAKALDLLKSDRTEDAEQLFRLVAEERELAAKSNAKEAAPAYRNLGAIAGLADPKRARDAYGRAVALDPDDREALYWHGYLQLLAGDVGSAEKDIVRLISTSRTNGDDRGEYRGHLLMIDLFIARGDLQNAQKNGEQAQKIVKQNAGRRPEDLNWQRDLALLSQKLGVVYLLQGRTSEADNAYNTAVELFTRLVAAAPNNKMWQRDFAIAEQRRGLVLLQQGKLRAALTSFQSALARDERLSVGEPKNITYQYDIAINHEYVGDALKFLGDLTTALTEYKKKQEILVRLTQADPNNRYWQYAVGLIHERMGDVLKDEGDFSAALREFKTTQEIVERLTQIDPKNSAWRREVAVVLQKIGDLNRAEGKASEALGAYRASLGITEQLAKDDTSNAGWQYDLGSSHERVGDVLLAEGDHASALVEYQTELNIVTRLASNDPQNTSWQHALSVSKEKIGDVLRGRGDMVGALSAYREVLAIRARLVKSDPENKYWERDLAVSHERIGDALIATNSPRAALNNFETSFAIRQRLVLSDSNNVQWQWDLVVSHWKLASLGDDTNARMDIIVKTLRRLDSENKLTADQRKWLITAEAMIR